MKVLVWLGILMGMLSCALEPYGATRSGQFGNEEAKKKGGDGVGVEDPVGVSGGEDWPFIYKDGDVKWRFSQDKITIGQVFSVRVDVNADTKKDIGLSFNVVECGDFFVTSEWLSLGGWGIGVPPADETTGNIDHISGKVEGISGGVNNLIIINGVGTSNSLPPYGACKLQVKAIVYSTGKKIASTQKLQLQKKSS